ncbi:MAG: hypothetical protein JXX28_11685 [Deltaproteobacteria bacterium]|nr:hypothetical protein [Deltaproteobacteria bacterium]
MRETQPLIEALELLSHDARRQLIVRRAHALSPAAIEALWAREQAWRLLALTAWRCRREAGRAAEALDASCRWLGREAAEVLVRWGSAEAVIAAARASGPLGLGDLSRQLLRQRRTDVAPAVFSVAIDRDLIRAAARLLPLCSHQVVAAHLDLIPPSHHVWPLLAARHPGLALELLERLPSLLDRVPAAAIPPLAAHAPARLLALLRRLPAESEGRPALLEPLLGALPERTLAWLLSPSGRGLLGGALPATALRHALREGPEVLVDALVRALPEGALGRVLRRGPSLFARTLLSRARPLEVRPWPTGMIPALPGSLRAAGARGALAHLGSSSPEEREELLSYLPPEEAERGLEQAEVPLQRRNLVLIRSALRYRRCIEMVERLLPEGPLGDEALLALADMPCTSLTPAQAPLLKAITWSALRSPDKRVGDAWEARARKVMGRVPDPDDPLFQTAREVLVDRAAHGRPLILPDFSATLRPEAVEGFVGRLAPWLRGASKREYHGNLIQLFRALGPLGIHAPALLQFTEEALRARPDEALYEAWLQPRPTRLARLLALIEERPEALRSPTVLAFAHRHAQHLLRTGQLPVAAWVELLQRYPSGLRRWLPSQRKTLAGRLPPGKLADLLLRGCGDAAPTPAPQSAPLSPDHLARRLQGASLHDRAELLDALPWTCAPRHLEALLAAFTATSPGGARDLLSGSRPSSRVLEERAAEVLADFEDRAGWRGAAELLLQVREPEGLGVLEDAVLPLHYLASYDDLRPSNRDMPATQRVRYLLARARSPEVGEEVRALLSRLVGRSFPLDARLLHFVDLSWDAPDELLPALHQLVSRAHPWEVEALHQGVTALLSLRPPLGVAVIGALCGHKDVAVRRVGLAAVWTTGQMLGWPLTLTGLLAGLRADPDPGLRFLARRRFTLPEGDSPWT